MSKTTEKAEPKEARPSGTLVRDPEQQALNKAITLLAELDDKARQRVLTYLNSRFGTDYRELIRQGVRPKDSQGWADGNLSGEGGKSQ